jgi:hypothetical protein
VDRITTAPLTFGQTTVSTVVRLQPVDVQAERNLMRRWQIPPGTTLDQVHQALAILAERHESLRTRFELDGDRPLQTVDPPGDLPVVVRPHDDDPDRCDELLRELASRPFELRRQHGWRAAVLCQDHTTPRLLALCFHHLVGDRYGLDQLESDFTALLGPSLRARQEFLDRPVLRPRELAREQRAAQWRDRRQRSLHRWAQLLDEIGDQPPPPRTVGRFEVGLRSATMLRAARAVARHQRVSVQSVLLTLTAITTAAVAHTTAPMVGLTVANRFDRRWSAIVSTMAQGMPLPVRLGPPRRRFADLVRSVHHSALTSMRHGCYDPDELTAMLAERGGSAPAFDYAFNQMPHPTDRRSYRLPAEHLERLVPRYHGGPRFSIWAFVGHDLLLILRADPDLVPEPAARQMLGWFRDELTRAAEGPVDLPDMITRLGLAPVAGTWGR